jgi:hypothetical protein
MCWESSTSFIAQVEGTEPELVRCKVDGTITPLERTGGTIGPAVGVARNGRCAIMESGKSLLVFYVTYGEKTAVFGAHRTLKRLDSQVCPELILRPTYAIAIYNRGSISIAWERVRPNLTEHL